MKQVFYRIVTENFAHEPGRRWPVEVLIQTEDPADFGDFRAAVEEVLDRIQERIDREEGKPVRDLGYLGKLEEKFVDSNSEDWDEYCLNVSQPEVHPKGDEALNMAEIAGRDRMHRMIDRGAAFEPWQLRLLRRLERQAAVGRRAVKVKRKRLKPRVRPALTFDCVRIDPRIAERYTPDLIRGILDAHRRAYERHAGNPHRDGFSSTVSGHGAPDVAVSCLTVFFDGGDSITFAALVSPGCAGPDDKAVMGLATEKFPSAENAIPRRGRAKRGVLA